MRVEQGIPIVCTDCREDEMVSQYDAKEIYSRMNMSSGRFLWHCTFCKKETPHILHEMGHILFREPFGAQTPWNLTRHRSQEGTQDATSRL